MHTLLKTKPKLFLPFSLPVLERETQRVWQLKSCGTLWDTRRSSLESQLPLQPAQLHEQHQPARSPLVLCQEQDGDPPESSSWAEWSLQPTGNLSLRPTQQAKAVPRVRRVWVLRVEDGMHLICFA